MNNILKCVAILSLCLASSGLCLEPGATAPRLKLTDRNGTAVDLQGFKGKVVYLDFWASWRGPCKTSLPWMKNLYEHYRQQGLEVVAINEDTQRDHALQMLDQLNPGFTTLFDEQGRVAANFELPTMPTSFVIGKDGEIRAVHHGFDVAEEAEIERSIKAALDSGR